MLGIEIDLTGHILEAEEDRRIYHNQVWYYKVYCQIIERGIEREKNSGINPEGYYEKHHILPKCMGGGNEKTNLVKLTAREHVLAHILLAKVYPHNHSINFAVRCILQVSNKYTIERNNVINEKFSTNFIAQIREQSKQALIGVNSGENNHMWGKHPSEETKKKQSLAKKGKYLGDKHPNYNKPMNDDQKRKISKTLKNNKTCLGGNNPSAKKVIDPWGNLWECINEAARYYDHARRTIRYWINNKPEKGWRFFDSEKDNIEDYNLMRLEDGRVGDNCGIKRINTGSRNGASRKVFSSKTGKTYNSILECSKSEEEGIGLTSLKKYLKDNPEKGYRYCD